MLPSATGPEERAVFCLEARDPLASPNGGGFPKLGVSLLRVPVIRTMVFLGSILGSPYVGKLPNWHFKIQDAHCLYDLLLHPKPYIHVRWTPHPVIVTIRDNKDYIGVLLYSYYTTITGWGLLLRYTHYSL